MTATTGTHRVTHVGICVSDLDRSAAFYAQALGFVETGRLQASGEETSKILGVPDVVLDMVYLERDGLQIELLTYAGGVQPGNTPRAMDVVGFTHLSIRVDSLEDLTGPIEAHGGSVLEDSLVNFEWGNRGVMALDPDGTRIELIEWRPEWGDK